MSMRSVGNYVMTGGRDKKLKVFRDGILSKPESFDLPALAKAIDYDESTGQFLLGLKNGSVYTMTDSGEMDEVMSSHSTGEVWGLAIHPE